MIPLFVIVLKKQKQMEPRPKLTEEVSWKKLQECFQKYGESINIYNLMKENPDRFNKFRYLTKLFNNLGLTFHLYQPIRLGILLF